MSAAVRIAIETAGAMPRDLPSYSPDINPSWNACNNLKAILRRAAARTIENLET